MNLDFFNQIGKNVKHSLDETQNNIKEKIYENIDEVEVDLAEKLNAIVEYTLDRFEGNIAVCEERNTGKIINIDKDKLPKDIKEGDIFISINGKYALEIERQEEVNKRIEDKMKDLWN